MLERSITHEKAGESSKMRINRKQPLVARSAKKKKDAFEGDYNDLSDRTERAFSDRYRTIFQIVSGAK
jgi:hypothetical protein